MHRDMKLGLSLGVLLVGIVGALFFRREPEKKEGIPPQLQDARQLDQLIAEKPHGPYITSPEDFADSSTSSANPSLANRSSSPAASKPGTRASAYEVPDFLSQEDEAAQRNLLGQRTSSTPDPIQPATAGQDKHAPSAPVHTPAHNPAHNSGWQTSDSSIAKKSAANKPQADRDSAADAGTHSGDAEKTHVIQPGDTLSTLASHYLGSSTRFREIYEANRDVLRSPDDLREGAALRIPPHKIASSLQQKTRFTSQAPDDARPNGPAARKSGDDAAEPGEDLGSLPPTPRPRNRKNSDSESHGRPTPDFSGNSDVGSQAPTTDAGPPKRLFKPVRRTPFSAGRTPRAESYALPADEPSPPQAEPRSKLPQIEVNDSADLLDSENEAFRPLSGQSQPDHGSALRNYKVQRGDTLERIAVKFYGRRSKVDDILAANRQSLSSPQELREGMELSIP